MSGSSLKPRWLQNFHAALRARLVLRAVLWAAMSFALVTLLGQLRGAPLTTMSFGVQALCWAIGGIVFYSFMRWWEAHDRAR